MDREEIKTILPHREPMLLVDRADMDGEESVSEYTIPQDAFFVQGHFPGNPVVPGVILCEIMAQGSVFLMKDELEGKLSLYAGMNNVKFKRTVRPGDTVVTRSHFNMKRNRFIVIDSVATVDGEVCCSGTLSFMLIDKPKE